MLSLEYKTHCYAVLFLTDFVFLLLSGYEGSVLKASETGTQQMQACRSVFLPPRFLCSVTCRAHAARPGSLGTLMHRRQDAVV